jgi:uracil-DNA glycosylase
MDGEQLLRRYLKQQRELGERELVLDAINAAEVMRIVRSGSTRALEEPTRVGRGARGAEPDQTSLGRIARSTDSAGPRGVPKPIDLLPPASAGPARSEAAPSAVAPAGLVVGAVEHELFGGPMAQAQSLADIANMVRDCTRCPLYATATQGVPGEGNTRARLMCVGEAPGASEDATGRPFVGQAGQLLTKILSAINLSREDVFIANVLKHRPPGNRNPRPEEVDACRPYLLRQIELIRPAVIVAFGTFAAQTLLETKLAIGRLRGLVHRYHGVPLIVTYHPAALLRNPAWKRPTWEDVQLARQLLDRAAT